jgi:transposase
MVDKRSVQELYQREARRMQAYELAQAGWKQKDIAEALGVTKGAVSQWMSRARDGGIDALRRHPAPGAVRRLSQEQMQRLPELLGQGATTYGYPDNMWTYRRIAVVVEREFGVHYVDQHIQRIVARMGWCRHKRSMC